MWEAIAADMIAAKYFREELEKREYDLLSPYAAKAAETRGRDLEEEKDLPNFHISD